MTTHHTESTENHVAKAVNHTDSASGKFQDQYQEMMHNGGNFVNKACKDITNGASHLDIPDIWTKGAAAVGHAGEQAGKALDSNPTTHFIKHDICDDNPVKAVVAGAAVAAVGTAVLAVAAPAALAAAGISEAVAGATVIIGGMGGYGLKMDYDNRHQKH